MDDDWQKQLDRERAIRAKHRAEARAFRAYHDGLGPEALAALLTKKLNMADIKNPQDLAERLERQALTLDSVFYTCLHDAGVGQKTGLDQAPLKAALNAQRQYRQIFDSLKSRAMKKTGNPTEGAEKCQE